jgi:hypothetical protein
LVYAGPSLARSGLTSQDAVGLLGLPVGVAALVVSVVALRKPPEGGLAELARGWASTLAGQVKEGEGSQWRQLLGDDTQRINLAFTLRPAPGRAAAAPAGAGRLFDGTSAVPDVAAFYRQTRPRRLVVTGASGSGKTVLALELMLALIEERGEDDPVPVRLSLAEWDLEVPLPDWVAQQLVDVYDWPTAMAAELVRQHRVLPVLDGLDEMDPGPGGAAARPDAPRARAALHALNVYQEGRTPGPVVLTCRAAQYEALAAQARLLDSAHIDIDPVPASDAHAYLRRRTPGPARWQPVLDVLDDDPAGTLATTLSTPWRLCLAATVYARDGDPADLLNYPSHHDLGEHLHPSSRSPWRAPGKQQCCAGKAVPGLPRVLTRQAAVASGSVSGLGLRRRDDAHLPPLPARPEPPHHPLELLPQPLGVRAVFADRQVRPDELPFLVIQLHSRHATRPTGPGPATRAKPAV